MRAEFTSEAITDITEFLGEEIKLSSTRKVIASQPTYITVIAGIAVIAF
jgi:hypothetical protein